MVYAWLSPVAQGCFSIPPCSATSRQRSPRCSWNLWPHAAFRLIPTTATSSLAHRNEVLIGFSKAGCSGFSILSFCQIWITTASLDHPLYLPFLLYTRHLWIFSSVGLLVHLTSIDIYSFPLQCASYNFKSFLFLHSLSLHPWLPCTCTQ